MLTTEYELFRMKDDESIQDMHTRFTSIINELHSLGEIIPRNKLVKNRGIPKRGSSSKPRGYDLCHKCDKPGHFIKDCPLLKQDQYKHNTYKAVKRNPVPDKRYKRKDVADNVVKQVLAAWEDSSSESGEDDEQGDTSTMTVESEAAEYDSIFSLIAKSDDDDDEVNFLDVQRNLKSYSQKKLICLANILIDVYHSLINDKNTLTVKLGEVKHERDDLVVVVVDLKETIEVLKKEKDVLTERIEKVEHERDDMLVVVVDLKETIEELKKGNNSGNIQKEKEVASEAYVKLENEIKSVKSSLCAELERNRQLQEDLDRVKNDLEKSLNGHVPMIQSLPCIPTMVGTGKESGFKRKRLTTINIASMLLSLITGFALTVATLDTLQKTVRLESSSNRKIRFLLKRIVKGSSQKWYMDSGCSKYMTGSIDDFLSLKALQGGSVSFGNCKKGYILGVGRIGKTLTHSIENMYYVNGLKYSLLSVSQIYDKGNKVYFLSKTCTTTNLVTGEVVLLAKRYKNIYVTDFESLHNGNLTSLSVVDDDAELWHRIFGHTSFSLLNKLVKKERVCGLPKSKFKGHKVCDACVRGKQVRSSFKPKNEVSISRPIDVLQMDLCGPMRVPSRGGKKYIFVIVDDYSRFTWTLFLRTNDETFPVFVAFLKHIQVKISHNVLPQHPQQNGVVERKNKTLEDMARTMLIDNGIEKGFWAEAVNIACYLVNRGMIRSLLNKILYELLSGRKPKLTHLRTFRCKCFVLNNGKEALGKFDAKSDERIFLGYSSQSKEYKVYNKKTQFVEESIHVIFDESYHLCGKNSHDKIDQDREQSKVPREVKEFNEENTIEPPPDA
ncbi:uncharacterized protein [Nicotiana tomentosiformis]|uniref:uncharacterized protein n=1 Tax=Nicotiana tomentosiformis TaxID=4098 RepID=UPI00388CB4A0